MYHHQVSGLSTVKSFVVYQVQHDWHLTEWFKAQFGLTVQWNETSVGGDRFVCFPGDWDLDIHYGTNNTVFSAASEYAVCYDGALADTLCELELGEKF